VRAPLPLALRAAVAGPAQHLPVLPRRAARAGRRLGDAAAVARRGEDGARRVKRTWSTHCLIDHRWMWPVGHARAWLLSRVAGRGSGALVTDSFGRRRWLLGTGVALRCSAGWEHTE
jgi:hypothetical protein